MKITDTILKKYAALVVRKGANVQKGQSVQIRISVEHAAFAALLSEEAYRAGAKKVTIDWQCEQTRVLDFTYADEQVLGEMLPWEREKLAQMEKDLPCMIYIDSADPDAYAALDAQKLSRVSQMRGIAAKPYNDAMSGKYQWVIAALPSPAWAKKCFPSENEDRAVEKLWEAILKTVHVSEDNDPLSDWEAHAALMTDKVKWLNSLDLRSLRYKSGNGTDFTVELIPGLRWEGAGEFNEANGIYFYPNMPTEEVFTTPYAGRCEGRLVSTRPLSWNGRLIENFALDFKDGHVVSCQAEKGQEVLEYLLQMDEGASALGEVALVPRESPVGQCGFLFYNTLFDENAACHLALGRGFRELLKGGNDMSAEEAKAAGINDSLVHVDFMVGCDDLSVTGICEDGSEVCIFRDGTWVR